MRDFRKYAVWNETRKLVSDVYIDIAKFPPEEQYGLTSQLRRACISVAANLAEGCGRDKEADLARFLDIAMGSAKEIECLLVLSNDLGFLTDQGYTERNKSILRVQSMLAKFLGKIR